MFNTITTQSGFWALLAFFIIGAFSSLIFKKDDKLANFFGHTFAILGSGWGILYSIASLLSDQAQSYSISSSFPILSLSFTIDKLSAFFIFIISLIALLCSIYATGYVRHFYKKYNIGTLGFFYNFFILGMLAVVTSSNGFFFLIAWEIMSLASYFLVIFERHEKDNIKAGFLYFIMTHIGTAFIIFAFLLLYKVTGSFDFHVIKDNIANISPLMKNMVFISALIGFGIKAGIIPLHIWLPSAHPAAPSHISAMMSSVMIKSGIFMFIRVFLDILPNAPLWWGLAILIIGSVSALLGVLYALTEHDLKRLLAYHSIENIGIILLGIGSALVFSTLHMTTLATLGLIAALYHTLNHATFKALLFLGAGSVISKTHTRNIEEYGGLIKYMPQTALFFLIGSLAISAMPPFNGFFSEWLTYQSLFQGIQSAGALTQWVFILAAGSLAFTGGLAAACFVKAFGATFLARSRSDEAKHAEESSLPLQIGMGILAVLTLVFGIFSGYISTILNSTSKDIGAFRYSASAVATTQSQSVKMINGFSSVSMMAVFIALSLTIIGAIIVIFIINRDQKIKRKSTWDCGTNLAPRMEITATGFSRSIITVFKGILRPSMQAEIEYQDSSMRYFPKSRTVAMEIQDVYKSYFYKPLQELVIRASDQAKKIQSGNVNAYILYIFIILILLLLAI